MRASFLIALFIFIVCSFASAQLPDDEARRLYDEAEQQYESQNYYNCYQQCISLSQLMNKNTPKVLYLMIKAVNNNLETDKESSKNKLTKSYENYTKFYGYTTSFLKLVDPKTYPTEKLKEIELIRKSFEKGITLYEFQKGRTPEDAVAFLNDCAAKFPRKRHGERKLIFTSVKFTFESPYLRVIDYNLQSSYIPGTEFSGVTVTFIDLSRINGIVKYSLDAENAEYLKCANCEIWEFSGFKNVEKPINGGELKRTFVDGIVESRRLSYRTGKDFSITDKSLWADTAFLPQQAFSTWKDIDEIKDSSRYKKNPSNLYFLSNPNRLMDGALFNEEAAEFQSGDYATRIKDAIQYLIDYVPKKQTTPNEGIKIDRKSKF